MQVTKRDLLEVGLRLMGIWVALQGLTYGMMYAGVAIPWLNSGWRDPATLLACAVIIGGASCLIGGGIALIFASHRFACLLLPGSDGDHLVPQTSASPLMATGIALLGIWLLAVNLPQLVAYPVSIVVKRLTQPDQPENHATRLPITAVIQVVVGAVLFLRANGVANLWKQLQSSRYVRREETEEPPPVG